MMENNLSVEPNKTIVRRFYEEFVNTGKVDGIEEIISENYIEVHDGKRYAAGIEGARAHILGVRQTYSGLHLTVDLQIAEGDWVATCITARGTHSGEWMGMKPTDKPVTFTGVNIDKVVDGRIVEHGGAANMLGPLMEIGAVKVIGSAE